MWRYPIQHLSPLFVKEVETKLLCSSKQKKFYAYGEIDNTLLLPRFYFSPIFPFPEPYAKLCVDVSLTRWNNCEFQGQLYSQPPQDKAVQAALQTLREDLDSSLQNSLCFGGTLSLKLGFGRMVVGLYVTSVLQTRTIVVASTQKKQKKWQKTIREFFPNANDDILVFTPKLIQIFNDELLKTYGFVILDDVNRIDLPFFANFLNLWNVKRILGLTSSPSYDHPLIGWSVGPVVFDSENVWAESSSMETGKQSMEITQQNRVGKMFHISKHSATKQQLEEIRKDLFMQPKLYDAAASKEDFSFNAYTENEDYINVPRFYGIEKYGIPEQVEISPGVPMSDSVQFYGTLKEENPPQREGHDIAINTMNSAPTSGSILNYYCGAGKTVISLAIAVTKHMRTLILVHTVDLLEQWINRIGRFVPKATVGRIQQNTCDVKGKDFVVGMIQSISSRDYPTEDMDTFGLCIVDECHRIACRFFSSALTKIPVAHILGLSATAYRKDGMNPLLFWSCGPIRFSVARPFVRVNVKMIEYKPKIRVRMLRGGTKHNRARMLNDLAEEESRNQMVLNEITKCYMDGRTMIFLTERLSMVRWLKQKLKEDMLFQGNFGICTGEVNQKERDESLKKKIILATYQKAREGLDVPQLDTLIMGSPVSDVIQATGRILREMPEKDIPLIVDIWDNIDPFLGSGHARRRYYKKKGFFIEDCIF